VYAIVDSGRLTPRTLTHGSALDLTLLLVGLLGLWLGTDFALEAAVRISERFGVSKGFIGLTLLAIGTGLPELVVGVVGGVEQLGGLEASGVVVGNATGSAIAQGALVLGLSGLFAYLRLAKRMIRRDGITLLLAIGLFAVVGLDGTISRTEGVILMIVYAIYLAALLQAERTGRRHRQPQATPAIIDFVTVAVGMVTVVVAAHVVVTRAISIAEAWNVSQTLIGIFLVGAGTSLPELALSIRAAIKGQSSISVGNVIGSNTFDLLVPIGASATVFPLTVGDDTLAFDVPVLGLITVATLIFFMHRKGLQKSEAVALLFIYLTYALLRVFAI
jgi:cation:H+ antiporter